VASALKLGEEMIFETGIAFKPSKSAISLISVAISSTFLHYALAIISTLSTRIISWPTEKN